MFLGEETGEVTGWLELEVVVDGRLVLRLAVHIPVVGPSGLLKRLVRFRVLVGVGVSLEVSTGEESFGVCWQ